MKREKSGIKMLHWTIQTAKRGDRELWHQEAIQDYQTVRHEDPEVRHQEATLD